MNWVEGIRDGIQYIEEHLEEEITIEDVAKHVCISSFYYQKAFSILCGFSVSEYIRYHRLFSPYDSRSDTMKTSKSFGKAVRRIITIFHSNIYNFLIRSKEITAGQ